MFQLPGTQRVRRQDLLSPAPSPPSSPDPALDALLRARINRAFEFAALTSNDRPVIADDVVPSDGEDEAELRLFAAPLDAASTTPTAQKIRLSSPDAADGDPSMRLRKPRSYYFADAPTSDEYAALQAAAMDGKTVLALSQDPWPGCALPWKVRTISAAGLKKEVLVGHPPALVTVTEQKVPKRTRKSKKTRIAIRKKLQAAKAKQTEKARLAQEKEEAEREKRTRRNREKKLKKKARDQAKKASVDTAGQQDKADDSDANQ